MTVMLEKGLLGCGCGSDCSGGVVVVGWEEGGVVGGSVGWGVLQSQPIVWEVWGLRMGSGDGFGDIGWQILEPRLQIFARICNVRARVRFTKMPTSHRNSKATTHHSSIWYLFFIASKPGYLRIQIIN